MFRKGQVHYDPIPLPDRVQLPDPEAVLRAESFRDYMRKRHSVRQFSTQAVPQAIIASAVEAAGLAPSGANHQPWFFAAISNPAMKQRIRDAAEDEERAFYAGGAGAEWLAALEPIGTGVKKPHLTDAPWLIVVFAQRCGQPQMANATRTTMCPKVSASPSAC